MKRQAQEQVINEIRSELLGTKENQRKTVALSLLLNKTKLLSDYFSNYEKIS
ncbi:hypothetical protein [Thermoflavimicrobium dichotomicum]|uniref:hypothetical protein n=1 Tax=Thermoflavimicrobium dichotomicum TaxID=46223 RepID=UPI001587D216|nr:hypothetical protein [Thermoflavimicrobium dichotomicum]